MTSDLQITVQPHAKLSQSFQYQYYNLFDNSGDELEYDVHIFISKTTCQLNKYLYMRAVLQYDSFLETILTDALISFKLIPGTVIQVGYGSQYENKYWDNNEWRMEHPNREYLLSDRSLYLKASYRYQF